MFPLLAVRKLSGIVKSGRAGYMCVLHHLPFLKRVLSVQCPIPLQMKVCYMLSLGRVFRAGPSLQYCTWKHRGHAGEMCAVSVPPLSPCAKGRGGSSVFLCDRGKQYFAPASFLLCCLCKDLLPNGVALSFLTGLGPS